MNYYACCPYSYCNIRLHFTHFCHSVVSRLHDFSKGLSFDCFDGFKYEMNQPLLFDLDQLFTLRNAVTFSYNTKITI